MKEVILVGGGGHCKAVIDVIEAQKCYRIKGILDKTENIGKFVSGYPIIGTDDDTIEYINKGYLFVITIGQINSSNLRERIFRKLEGFEAIFATIVSPMAYVSTSATIGCGSVVMHGAIINSEARIGENCIINSKSLIEHESIVHSHSHVSTGTVLNGCVEVGQGSFVGSGSIVIQGTIIPEYSFIKARSCFHRNKKKVAFLTTIFPTKMQYIDEFMISLVHQDYKNFDLILVNDGFENIDKLITKYPEINIIEVESKDNIAKNREVLINYSIKNKYDIGIFGDIDDYFSPNRIDDAIKKLNYYDILVNDFTSFNYDGVINRNYISNRFSHNQVIRLNDILDKNIFGLSNTAVNLNKINSEFLFNKDLIAVDWYFFSLLLNRDFKAVFSNKSQTYYRQYENNTVGVGENNKNALMQAKKVKSLHY
ncbi:NeuD/PglB/VioB family sugar acetyltransferase, partial [Aliivibrio sifiae]